MSKDRLAGVVARINGRQRTGWPAGMLQDDSSDLSKWLSNKPGAYRLARDATENIRRSATIEGTNIPRTMFWKEQEDQDKWDKTVRWELTRRLTALTVGSCTCCTKTPEVVYHREDCHYRLASEVATLLWL